MTDAASSYDAKMEEIAELLTEAHDLVVPAMSGPDPDEVLGLVEQADEALTHLRLFLGRLRYLAGE
jgi:hypothetical protein